MSDSSTPGFHAAAVGIGPTERRRHPGATEGKRGIGRLVRTKVAWKRATGGARLGSAEAYEAAETAMVQREGRQTGLCERATSAFVTLSRAMSTPGVQ